MTGNNPPNKEDKESKAGYDGRLQYFDILKNVLNELHITAYQKDYANWMRGLYGYFSMTQAFIKPAARNEIKITLTKLRDRYGYVKASESLQRKREVKDEIDHSFREVMDEMLFASRGLLLPIKENEDEEFDFDSFKRGSDL